MGDDVRVAGVRGDPLAVGGVAVEAGDGRRASVDQLDLVEGGVRVLVDEGPGAPGGLVSGAVVARGGDPVGRGRGRGVAVAEAGRPDLVEVPEAVVAVGLTAPHAVRADGGALGDPAQPVVPEPVVSQSHDVSGPVVPEGPAGPVASGRTGSGSSPGGPCPSCRGVCSSMTPLAVRRAPGHPVRVVGDRGREARRSRSGSRSCTGSRRSARGRSSRAADTVCEARAPRSFQVNRWSKVASRSSPTTPTTVVPVRQPPAGPAGTRTSPRPGSPGLPVEVVVAHGPGELPLRPVGAALASPYFLSSRSRCAPSVSAIRVSRLGRVPGRRLRWFGPVVDGPRVASCVVVGPSSRRRCRRRPSPAGAARCRNPRLSYSTRAPACPPGPRPSRVTGDLRCRTRSCECTSGRGAEGLPTSVTRPR